MKLKKWMVLSIGAITVITAIFGYMVYHGVFMSNIKNEKSDYEIYIRENYTVQQIIDTLVFNNVLIHQNNFPFICQLLGFKDESVKEGRYILKAGMSNYKIINKLKGGYQDPLKITINNVRDMPQLCGKISHYLILDSVSLMQKFTDSSFLTTLGYTKENFMSLFIPNTYELYWNISLDKFVSRMQLENKKFWNNEQRKQKAEQLNLDEKQIYTLASIVEKETNYEPERPSIAGVYLNRLKTGMKLQADPTVVFALGVPGLQRVLLAHLTFDSPYNTYMVEGLPPGPIYMPTINSIDAVLNYEKHDYIFFCAKEGNEGSHSFASTLKQHTENAKKYQAWLNKLH